MPTAASLVAELKEKYGVEASLVATGGGLFEVTVNGSLIFSKKQLGRFPEPEEIQRKIDGL